MAVVPSVIQSIQVDGVMRDLPEVLAHDCLVRVTLCRKHAAEHQSGSSASRNDQEVALLRVRDPRFLLFDFEVPGNVNARCRSALQSGRSGVSWKALVSETSRASRLKHAAAHIRPGKLVDLALAEQSIDLLKGDDDVRVDVGIVHQALVDQAL